MYRRVLRVAVTGSAYRFFSILDLCKNRPAVGIYDMSVLSGQNGAVHLINIFDHSNREFATHLRYFLLFCFVFCIVLRNNQTKKSRVG